MSVLDSDPNTLATIISDPGFDEAQVAAAAFLARYSGRTLDAYRYDLRVFSSGPWIVGLILLEAKRPHIELYRTAWRRKDSLRPPSTGGYPRSVASTALPTSTVG